MKLSPQSQAAKMIAEKEKILVLAHAKLDGDSASSMLSLLLFLRKMGKTVSVVSAEGITEKLKFLPASGEIRTEIEGLSDFVISLDCAEVEPQGLKYNLDDGKLFITITPKPGQSRSFLPSDISFEKGANDFDLIITVDAGDLEHLGRLYEEHTDLFYSIPVINIDHHASNTGFGTVNVVDTTAASTTEILYRLFSELSPNEQRIDEEIATLLLAGLITDTGSFQNANTSPKCLEVAAHLTELGARQQEIIQKIFKTRPLSTLRLWGKALSKIEWDPLHRLVWSSISAADLDDAGAEPDETEGLIDELLSNAPGAEVVMLFRDNRNGMVSASLRTTNFGIDGTEIARHFGGGGHRQAAGFKIREKALELVIAEAIDFVKQWQSERLGIEITEEKEEHPHKKMTHKPHKAAVVSIPAGISDAIGATEGIDIVRAVNTPAHITVEVPTAESQIPEYVVSEMAPQIVSEMPINTASAVPTTPIAELTTSATTPDLPDFMTSMREMPSPSTELSPIADLPDFMKTPSEITERTSPPAIEAAQPAETTIPEWMRVPPPPPTA